MYLYRTAILCILAFWLAGCQQTTLLSNNLKQDKFIRVYFNHRESTHYQDPYRQIERQGDNLEAIVIDEINAARSTIDLAVQEFRLPQIALALANKQRSGVRVRVILDNNYSRPLSEISQAEINRLDGRDRRSYEEFIALADSDKNGRLSEKEIATGDALIVLRQAGIPVIDDTADGSKGSGLMHHKLVIIDRQKIITGSANFTLSGIHGDFANPQTQGNVNHLLTIDNAPLANLFVEEFDYMWGDGMGKSRDSKFGLDKPKRLPQTLNWENTQAIVQFSPTSPTQDWSSTTNGLIGKTLERATSSIDLALFVFSDQKLANILESLHQRVNIETVFDPGFAFRYYSSALDMLGVELRNGCKPQVDNRPWQSSIQSIGIPQLALGDKLHHKFALVDEKIVITGSQNWSPSANFINDETVLIINNPTVAKQFQQEF
ncbi:phosphatidylserine/phosphatidylglycerophosphate/cardiolipin synthase family protein [Myxosarcina sp. GI1]|uniref:phospholipase D-like domain-containing protein n=1 Tax=Myxosarcina sp. GI1 TaxID=1541065 RepID=UPI000ADB773E|nr:phospholipase D-like domain-containing protein [Myxosarcina sp. GI1]